MIRIPSGLPCDAAAKALSIQGVHAGYGNVEVLHGIDIEVPVGSIVAVLGPNGAGKTTLCNVLAGMLLAGSGSVSFFGEDIGGLQPHERAARGLLLVPESRGVFPALTVDENLALLLPRSEERELAYSRFPNLDVRRRLSAGNLSGGEQQMLGLAPMLVNPPRLLVVDEPTLGLAEKLGAVVMSAIAELPSRGTTVVLVEEKARGVLKHADYVNVLYNGEVRWRSSTTPFDISDLEIAYRGETIHHDAIETRNAEEENSGTF